MPDDNFIKLELAETATILDEINPLWEGAAFDPVQTTVMAQDVSYYPGYQFLDIADHSAEPALHCYAMYRPGEPVILDWSNEPIYALNLKAPIRLSSDNVADYVRFFFTYVRGRHGRFIITENVDDIQWKEEPPPPARKAIAKMLEPVTVKKVMPDGTYYLEARMMFKDALFKSDVHVKPNGLVSLRNEELLIEDMPVLDDTFGQ